MTGRGAFGLIVAVLFGAVGTISSVQAQGTGRPAELPSADYAGLQYVDSQGCLFLRAGTEGDLVWVPRVTAGGHQMCGYPPSGNRVPVVGEPSADEGTIAPATEPAPAAEAVAEPEAIAPEVKKPEVAPAPSEEPADTGSYVVAIGSFGFPSNVAKAIAAADALGYPALTGQLAGGEKGLVTVYAGPFDHKPDATDALDRLQDAGFPDAILMKQ